MPFFLNPNSPFWGGGQTGVLVINGWYGFAVAIGLLFGALALGLVLMSAWRPRPAIKLLGMLFGASGFLGVLLVLGGAGMTTAYGLNFVLSKRRKAQG